MPDQVFELRLLQTYGIPAKGGTRAGSRTKMAIHREAKVQLEIAQSFLHHGWQPDDLNDASCPSETSSNP